MNYCHDSPTTVSISAKKCRRGRTYHLRWVSPTTGKWKSLKVKGDKKTALKAAAALEDELRKGTYREVADITWDDFVDDHVLKLPGQANATEAERTLKEFGKITKVSNPNKVTFSMIEFYVATLRKKGNAVPTLNKKLRYIRAGLNKAIRRGFADRSPMSGWEWQREEQKLPRVLTEEEKAKLLKACPDHQWRTFVQVALITGCRRGELLSLKWDKVDFDNARLTITGTKAHCDRVQPISSDEVTALRELQASTLKDGGPFISIRYNTGKHFQEIVKAAGIAYCSIHDLRRTFCTDLARLDVNQLVVQRLAGHASGATTAKYYQRVDEAMKREAVVKLRSKAG